MKKTYILFIFLVLIVATGCEHKENKLNTSSDETMQTTSSTTTSSTSPVQSTNSTTLNTSKKASNQTTSKTTVITNENTVLTTRKTTSTKILNILKENTHYKKKLIESDSKNNRYIETVEILFLDNEELQNKLNKNIEADLSKQRCVLINKLSIKDNILNIEYNACDFYDSEPVSTFPLNKLYNLSKGEALHG